MSIGRFIAGIGALIFDPINGRYLLLKRAGSKDFAANTWEPVTGRVDQGEGYEDALHREVFEEVGLEIRAEYLLGTSHFYRGRVSPETELLGLVYLCRLVKPGEPRLSAEHSEFRWVTAAEAFGLLTSTDPPTQWTRRVIAKAEIVRSLAPQELMDIQGQEGFELG